MSASAPSLPPGAPISELRSLLRQLESTDLLLERALETRAKHPPAGGVTTRETLVPSPPPPLDEPLRETARKAFEEGRRAAEKLTRGQPPEQLTPGERRGLEAIILVTGRPALLIQEGRFFDPPPRWQILQERRDPIQETFASIGRIEVTGHPDQDWLGTGFVVGDGVIMTNRHVAVEFCRRDANGRWGFEPGVTASIDFLRELGTAESLTFPVEEILGIHEGLDLALLRIARTSAGTDQGCPPPLALAAHGQRPAAGRPVYVVGYPAWDGRRNDPESMGRIFSNVYGVKRLQPGEVMGQDGVPLAHDCSTLGGNSGSPVIDLESHRVVGLHYWGRFREANRAVWLAGVRDDPLLRANDLNFT